MGIILGKFRKKKSTYEALETIDKEIKTIEEYRRNTEQTHKRIVGRFIVISVMVYLLTAFTFYFYYFPATFYDRMFYIIPLILAPVIILTVKRVLSIYYKWKISRKQNKLASLRDEKKKMLESVMETETYKVAKTILEKFAPDTVGTRKSSSLLSSEFATPQRPTAAATVPPTVGLRQRALPASNQQFLPTVTPARSMSLVPSTLSTAAMPALTEAPRPQSAGVLGSPLPMPRAILPRERSVFDKMVDYLVGDGPANRYALICKNCFSHNGMAFREEFEYISFRCCYCYSFNPARKQRPAAPKLEFALKSPHDEALSDTSESEKNSPSDSDSETEVTFSFKAAEIPNISDVYENIKPLDVEPINQEKFMPMDVDALPVKMEENNESIQLIDKLGEIMSVDDIGEVSQINGGKELKADEKNHGKSDDITKD